MHINLEATENHSIQAYSDEGIKVHSQIYTNSLIISRHEIISDWPITSIQALNQDLLEPLLRHQPKIIIIGHQQPGQFASLSQSLARIKPQIGLEIMSIGAACRTFNLLLSEQREVVIGIIMNSVTNLA